MTNAELITELTYCANIEKRKLLSDAADVLEAAEKRIDGLQKLVDINTERCEALRKQLRESHEDYEKHINELTTKCNQLQAAVDNYEKRIAELESQAAFFDAEKQNYQENIEYRDERIKELEAQKPKEGEWIEDEYGYIHCSECKMEWDEPEHPQTKYCPNCGARMRGEDDGK